MSGAERTTAEQASTRAVEQGTEPSDETLLAAYAAGDLRAFETLLVRYESRVYNVVLRMVKQPSTAEELTQDAFLKIIQRSSEFRGQSKFSTWLFTIARNLCIDHIRKMRHRRHRSLDAPVHEEGGDMHERVAAQEPQVDRQAIRGQMQAAMEAAVAALPDDQREVFVLRQVQNMPFKDIAEMVGITENTAKSRMRYALERLKAALAEYETYLRPMD